MTKKEYYTILLLCLIFLIIGLFMLNFRWINPDEGAHLADGKLLLEGQIPCVDYSSRAPFYTLLTAVFMKLFGVSFLGGRVLPLISSIGVGVLIYLIARKLFSRDVALTSMMIYIFLPFTIMFSSIAKMENNVIFLGCLGILFYIHFWEKNKFAFLAMSGVALGLAYYVRQSSLAVLMTVMLTIILVNGKNISKTIKQISIFLVGFFSIACLVLIFYLNYMDLNAFWNSGNLNPFILVLDGFSKIISCFTADPSSQLQQSIGMQGQDMSHYTRYLKDTIKMNLYLVLGLLLFLIYYFKDQLSGNISKENKSIAVYILPIWSMTTFILYGYYFFARGFFPQYATEIFPPLIMCLSYVIAVKFIPKGKSIMWYLVTIIVFLYSVFAFNKFIVKDYPALDTYFLTTISLVFIYYFSREKSLTENRKVFWFFASLFLLITTIIRLGFVKSLILKGVFAVSILMLLYFILYITVRAGLIRKGKIFRNYVAMPLIVSTLVFSFSFASFHLGISYDGNWSPRSVKTVERYLKKDSVQGDSLLSGSMIWIINPKIKPFFNITHPAAFRGKVDDSFKKQLENELESNPPNYIVMDGRTEMCYSFVEKFLKALIKERYVKEKEISDVHSANYPITIYKLKPSIPL